MKHGLSIIIPAYNAEQWIVPTTQKIDAAVERSDFINTELIIIDDGSTDATYKTAQHLSLSHIKELHILTHPNKGRFLTRKRGVVEAAYDTIFFVDTRVWIDENSLAFISQQRREHPERKIWNGDVKVAKEGNLIARFGDALTCIGWRRYHRNPRLLSYGLKDFDHYPKGTGIFIAPTQLIKDAISWFEGQTNDIKNSSDDTLMIRYMARHERIWISPDFTSTYFARTTLKAFIKHTYYRGQFFVDGFLRRGTRFYYPLIVFLAGTFMGVILLAAIPQLIPYAAVVFLVLWLAELIVALSLWIEKKDALALFILSPVFAVFYGLGIWRAFLRKLASMLMR